MTVRAEAEVTLTRVDDGTSGSEITIVNGYWYIDGVSTGVKATGDDGNTPYIQDGYWYIDGKTTGIEARGPKGDPGKSLVSITEYYALNNSTTAPADSEFGTTIKTPTSSNKYVWNYELMTWDDNGTTSTTKTDKHIVAVYGDEGNAGKSLTGITEYYALNNSTTAPADSEFSTSVKTPTSTSRYVWNYELLSWDDNGTTSTTRTEKHIAAVYGETGDTAEWFYGTALTHTSGTATATVSGAVVGSMYLNTSTSLVYKCTAISGSTMTWTYAGDLTTGVIDNIELGGRNYLENSRTMGGYFTNYNHSAGDRSHVVWDDGYCYMELIGSTSDWNGVVGMPTHRIAPVLLDGSDWTVSFDYKCSSNTTAFFAVSGSSLPIGYLLCQSNSRTKYTGWDLTLENTSGEWQRTEVHFNKKVSDLTSGSGNVTSWFIQLYNRTANTLQVRKVKLERGNIATDWTPAPEDITTGGGNNLLRGTATMGNSSGGLWSDGLFYGSGTGTRTFKYAISDSPISNISTGFLSTATTTGTTVTGNGFAQSIVPVAKKQVVISAWVKGTAGDYVSLQPIWSNASAERPEGGQMNWQLPDSNWHRLEWWKMPMYDHSDGYATATTYTLNAGYVYHKALTVGNTLTVCGLKLEYGGKATDWSPSTLEVDSAIDDAAKTASRYITAIDQSGIKVHAENGVGTNYSQIDATGMTVYNDSQDVAKFGDKARIGGSNNARVEVAPTNITAYDPKGAVAFKVQSDGAAVTRDIEVRQNIDVFVGLRNASETYTLPNTPISNSTIRVYFYARGDDHFFSYNYGESGQYPNQDYPDYDSTGVTISYSGNTITATATQYGIGEATVDYTIRTTNSLVEIPAELTIQTENFTQFLFDPPFSTTGLTDYESRVEWIEGGYTTLGKWVFVSTNFEMNVSLGANNNWAVIDHFPLPWGNTAPLHAECGKKMLNAYVNSNGRLVIITGSSALATGDEVQISGWYLKE